MGKLIPHILILPFLITVSSKLLADTNFVYGAGVTTFNINHYRGSDQSKTYILPIPYFSYSNEILEAETSYVRGSLVKTKDFTVKLSLTLGLKVESEENDSRAEMPDLGYAVEAGPMLIYVLKRWNENKTHIQIEFPWRKVIATDFSYIKTIGVTFQPYINLVMKPQDETFGWGSEFSLCPYMWASKDYHNYYYGVSSDEVTENRREYHGRGGYSGSHIIWILSKRIGHILALPFLRYDYLKGSVFSSGPLHKSDHYWFFGSSFVWVF